MLPSPQTSEDVLAPTSFQPGGAEIPTIRATVIWRNSQRHRGGGVLAHTTWIALGEQCSAVGCSVFASLAPRSFLFPMTAPYVKSHIYIDRDYYSTGRCHLPRPY